MANEVYANGMELACKAGAGKTICAFPDVCFTPPENPATPPGVPIPYPNTGFASDTTEGSKTVKISGKEIMLKNKSYFKTSTGDEAGCAAKKGVISSKNTGKVYFIKWSMDVKFEGENVDRHLDMTTNNHGSPTANEAVPWPFTDGAVIPPSNPACDETGDRFLDEFDELPKWNSRIHHDNLEKTVLKSYGKRIPATTLALGMIVNGSPGAPKFIPGHSRASVRNESTRKHYAKGASNNKSSKAPKCGNPDEKFEYKPTPDSQHPKSHAEARIIEDWFKDHGGVGQLVLWVSRPTCPSCAELIKHINCGSGGERCNKILVCDKHQDDNSRENLKC